MTEIEQRGLANIYKTLQTIELSVVKMGAQLEGFIQLENERHKTIDLHVASTTEQGVRGDNAVWAAIKELRDSRTNMLIWALGLALTTLASLALSVLSFIAK